MECSLDDSMDELSLGIWYDVGVTKIEEAAAKASRRESCLEKRTTRDVEDGGARMS